MDFGLDKLIEMFEERFGKPLASGLLFLIGLGAAAWALHSFAVYFVIPTAKYASDFVSFLKGRPIALTEKDYFALLFQAAWGLLSAGIVWLIFRVLLMPHVRKNLTRVEALIKYAEEIGDDIDAGIQALEESIEDAKIAGIDVSKIKIRPFARTAKRPPAVSLQVQAPLDKPKEK